MERYFETTFRFKWLFLLVLLIVPVLGVRYAMKSVMPMYPSTATIWSEKPQYVTVVSDWSQYLTPAQNQANDMSEMLSSDTFAQAVIDETDLKGLIRTRTQQQLALTTLRKQTTITPVGTHIVQIVYTDQQAKIANQMVKAIIDVFSTRVLADANSQSAQALSFYQTQLDAANAKLSDATASLRSYLDAHPELTVASQDQLPQLLASASFSAQYPEAVQLVQALQQATKDQQTLQDQVNSIRSQQSQASISQAQAFRVLDQPSTPNTSTRSLKKLMLPIGLSMGVAIGFVIGGIILITIFDTTLRNPRIAAARFNLPVLGALPLLPAQRKIVRRRQFRRREVRTLLALEALLPTVSGGAKE